MQAQGTSRRGGAAFIWKWGAIAGVILGVIQILLSLLSLGGTGTIIELLVWLIGFFVIGLFAARHSGRVATGTLTGLVAGLVSGLLAALVGIIEIAANGAVLTQTIKQVQQQNSNLSPDQIHTAAVVGIIIGLILVVAIELGLGAGIGALGGLVGRRQSPVAASTSYTESLWTPSPQPPLPPGPGAPQE